MDGNYDPDSAAGLGWGSQSGISAPIAKSALGGLLQGAAILQWHCRSISPTHPLTYSSIPPLPSQTVSNNTDDSQLARACPDLPLLLRPVSRSLPYCPLVARYESLDLSPPTRKRFGQHWLKSEAVLHKILAAAQVTREDTILEIGPGTGILTRWLLPLAGMVVAVEIDWDLCRKLRNQFERHDNFLLLQGDILEIDVNALLRQQPDFPNAMPDKVVANIPYYITGPILEKLLGTIASPNPQPFQSIVLLVQKEVAERLYARAGSKAFGALSVRVQYLADCELVCPVPAKAFQPPPKVDSAVVKLSPRSCAQIATNPAFLDQLVKQGFSSKRKMLRNNLKSSFDRDMLAEVMTSLEIAPTARAEDIPVEQWVALSNRLSNTIWNQQS